MSHGHDQIIWLASYPKSGNTWLRCFLDAYLLGEVDINDIICSVPDDLSDRHQIGDGTDVSKLPVDLQQLTRPMALLRLVRQFNANKFADVPLFVKTHNANVVSNGIELITGCLTKGVVHIVRDPRDVVLSLSKHMGLSIDDAIEHMCDKHKCINDERFPKVGNLISSWQMSAQSYLDCGTHNIKTFRYEDMRSHPQETFTAILAHIGIDADAKRVTQSLEAVKLSRLREQEKQSGFRESSPHAKDTFFGKGLTGGWKHILTPMQVKRIEKRMGSYMSRLGYLGSKRKWQSETTNNSKKQFGTN